MGMLSEDGEKKPAKKKPVILVEAGTLGSRKASFTRSRGLLTFNGNGATDEEALADLFVQLGTVELSTDPDDYEILHR